jgi:hypothetical protein
MLTKMVLCDTTQKGKENFLKIQKININICWECSFLKSENCIIFSEN